MINEGERRAVARLAEGISSVRPLAVRLAGPGGIAEVVGAGDVGPPARVVVDHVLARLGVPAVPADPGGGAGSAAGGAAAFVRVVRDRVGLPGLVPVLGEIPPSGLDAVDRVVDEVVLADLTTFCESAVVTAPDGARFPAYAAGDPQAPALVIAPACGMPVRLAERWIRRFAVDHRVLTWESRGLFGTGPDDAGPGAFGGATDVPAQSDDLLAVMDRFGAERAHVVGLCGGAVLALEAAARAPHRVVGLSLWHGDLDLGPGTPKTDHQRNLAALLGMAAGSPAVAARVHAVVCQAMLDATPPDLAHLVVHPYADPELLHLYCRLNGAIMGWDLSGTVARVDVPVLVVTSEDDRTAHPGGSRLVAERLASARLVVNPHGDHLSLFRAEQSFLDDAARLVIELASRV